MSKAQGRKDLESSAANEQESELGRAQKPKAD